MQLLYYGIIIISRHYAVILSDRDQDFTRDNFSRVFLSLPGFYMNIPEVILLPNHADNFSWRDK